jgi:lipopolysaccharide/colanic/teichoic acid biosynthesis glycosyltransferase/glycosyltransferase involved in cell wall biosynthesis
MHVLTVADSLIFLRGQGRFMRQAGFDVTAVSSPGPEQAVFADHDQARVLSLDMPRRITVGHDLLAVARLAALVLRERPAVVDAHTPKGGLLGMLAAWLARVPARVYHMRGLPAETATGLRRTILIATERVSCALAHRVVAVSPSLRARALALGLCRPDKITVLGEGGGDGIDARGDFAPDPADAGRRADLRTRLGIGADAPVVGFVGRLVRDKGVVELEAAWRTVRAAVPAAHLVVAGAPEPGDPVPASTLRALAEDPRVHLLGHVASTRGLYPAFDLLALPTYREGFPVVLLEAAALALPVVATRVTGCVDAVRDGETGRLVPPGDAAALAAAIVAYVRDPALAAAHGRAGRARVLRAFDRDRLSAELLALYETLLAGARRRAGWRGKRLADVLLVLATAPMWVPLALVVAALVRARIGRPVLFRQARPGLDGRTFELVKFRTMTGACDAAGRLLPDADRLTRFGRFLRSTSLDELPELWNVLRGDMSLVGPRPLLPQYLARYSARHRRRHDVRPGLTGLAQVSGRNALSWPAKFDLDVEYVERASPWLDARILLATVRSVLRRDGVAAAGPRPRTSSSGTTATCRADGRRRSRSAPVPPGRAGAEHPGRHPDRGAVRRERGDDRGAGADDGPGADRQVGRDHRADAELAPFAHPHGAGEARPGCEVRVRAHVAVVAHRRLDVQVNVGPEAHVARDRGVRRDDHAGPRGNVSRHRGARVHQRHGAPAGPVQHGRQSRLRRGRPDAEHVPDVTAPGREKPVGGAEDGKIPDRAPRPRRVVVDEADDAVAGTVERGRLGDGEHLAGVPAGADDD